MRRRLLRACMALTLSSAPVLASGEGPACQSGPVLLLDGLGTPSADLARAAELAGLAPPEPRLVRRGGARGQPLCAAAETFGWTARAARLPADERWWTVLPSHLAAAWNAYHPTTASDGLLWQGRGVGLTASVGLAARWGPLSAALAPEVAWQQNAWFETVPTGRPGAQAFANPFYPGQIDLPQRFGAGPFATASPGQSYLRVDAGGVALGVSSENLWLGPGVDHALLLTNAAAGFPHAFLGTSRPVDIWVGELEVMALWGQLERSAYATERWRPWFTALALDYQPRWIPGLYLGAGRGYVESWESLRADGLLSVVEPPSKSLLPGHDNPLDNQIATLWFRWVFPESGLEVYGEWGRDDFPISMAGLVREPRRTRGWVGGLQKVFRPGTREVVVRGEVIRIHDIPSPTDTPAWYTHPMNLDWTHRGQILGASVGPGGDAQRLTLDVLGPSGRIGGFVERTARNEEIYFARFTPERQSQHDVALVVGVRQTLLAGAAELSWELAAGYRWARDFVRDEPEVRVGVHLALPGLVRRN